MISFKLTCAKGHAFDQWFASSAEYAELKKGHGIACPSCGDTCVEKGLMTPAVAKRSAAPAPACGAPACSNGACPMSGLG